LKYKSQRNISKKFRLIKGNICLLGGWATYHIVNKDFEKTTGRKYIGSRDIGQFRSVASTGKGK